MVCTRMSNSSSGGWAAEQAAGVVMQDQSAFAGIGNGALDEADRIGLAERERPIATKHDPLEGNDMARIIQHFGLEAHRLEIQTAQIFPDRLRETPRQIRICVYLPLHAGPQRQTERAGMRADEFQPGVTIKRPAADQLQDRDRAVE